MRIRVLLGGAGVLLGLYGVFRLLTEIPNDDLLVLAVWLVAAVVLHDGILSPVIVGVGWTLTRFVPPRARRWAQGGLVAAALITVVALPLIYREDSQPASKGILRQDYTTNLVIALAIVLIVSVAGYAVSVLRPGSRVSTTNSRPPDDHTSTGE